MSFCAAFGCSNRTSRKSATQKEKPKLSFHLFPKNEPRRKLWVKACRRESWTPSARSVLCSEHFTSESFDRTSHSLIRLKPEAVPTIFPAFPHYLQKTPKLHKSPVFHQKVNHENNLISEAQPEQDNMDAIKEEPGSDQETYETEYYLVDANLEEQFVPIPFPALKTEDTCQEEPRVIPTLKEEKHNEITTEEHEVCLDRIDLNKQAHGTTSSVIDVGKTEERELDRTGRTDPLLLSEPDVSMSVFKYNVFTLIELVESRPCLWDKTADCFKDKLEKQKAWREVYVFLEENFLDKDKKEQQKIGEVITGKWHNIRDTFVKTLKKKSGQATSKKYLYHDNLQFFMKVVTKDYTESSIQESQQIPESGDGEQMETQDEAIATTKQISNSRKRPRSQDDIDREILKALTSSSSTPDEDEAFFISITPSVRRMCEEDKLQFRISVLKLLQDFQNRAKSRPNASYSPTSSSNSRTSPFPHYPTSVNDSTHCNSPKSN